MYFFRPNRVRLLIFPLMFITLQISYTQNFRIAPYTLNSGGHDMRNDVMGLKGSISQSVIGMVHSAGESNHQGFWYMYTFIRNKITPLQPITLAQPKLLIYPNPFSELLFLDVSNSMVSAHCTVVDMSGKVLQNHILTTGKSVLQLGNLASGTYLIRVRNEHFLYVRLIIKL